MGRGFSRATREGNRYGLLTRHGSRSPDPHPEHAAGDAERAPVPVDGRERRPRHLESPGDRGPPDSRRRNRLDPAGEDHLYHRGIAGVRAVRPIRAGPTILGLVTGATAGSIW